MNKKNLFSLVLAVIVLAAATVPAKAASADDFYTVYSVGSRLIFDVPTPCHEHVLTGKVFAGNSVFVTIERRSRLSRPELCRAWKHRLVSVNLKPPRMAHGYYDVYINGVFFKTMML